MDQMPSEVIEGIVPLVKEDSFQPTMLMQWEEAAILSVPLGWQPCSWPIDPKEQRASSIQATHFKMEAEYVPNKYENILQGGWVDPC